MCCWSCHAWLGVRSERGRFSDTELAAFGSNGDQNSLLEPYKLQYPKEGMVIIMKITVKMPFCLSPRLIDIRVAEGDSVDIGELLFSYEADGALLYEYAACCGTVSQVHAVIGREIRCGDAVMTVEAENGDRDGELFNSARKRGGVEY